MRYGSRCRETDLEREKDADRQTGSEGYHRRESSVGPNARHFYRDGEHEHRKECAHRDVLNNGKVLIAGGYQLISNGVWNTLILASAELYDPAHRHVHPYRQHDHGTIRPHGDLAPQRQGLDRRWQCLRIPTQPGQRGALRSFHWDLHRYWRNDQVTPGVARGEACSIPARF